MLPPTSPEGDEAKALASLSRRVRFLPRVAGLCRVQRVEKGTNYLYTGRFAPSGVQGPSSGVDGRVSSQSPEGTAFEILGPWRAGACQNRL